MSDDLAETLFYVVMAALVFMGGVGAGVNLTHAQVTKQCLSRCECPLSESLVVE